jgi:hypothetical protein
VEKNGGKNVYEQEIGDSRDPGDGRPNGLGRLRPDA